jgi:hypothetical protein
MVYIYIFEVTTCKGCATAQMLVAGFKLQKPSFDPRSGHVRSVVNKVALGQVFSEYFGFPCQFFYHQMLHTHLSSRGDTTGQLVTDVPSGLNIAPPHKIN